MSVINMAGIHIPASCLFKGHHILQSTGNHHRFDMVYVYIKRSYSITAGRREHLQSNRRHATPCYKLAFTGTVVPVASDGNFQRCFLKFSCSERAFIDPESRSDLSWLSFPNAPYSTNLAPLLFGACFATWTQSLDSCFLSLVRKPFCFSSSNRTDAGIRNERRG